jgi:hypothetical protein
MAWRRAVPLGLEEGLPMVRSVLSMNRYRLAGELVCALTRAMLGVPPPGGSSVPPLAELPVGVVVRSLVASEDAPPELLDHLALLVEQELRFQDASTADARRLVAFWSRALPGGDFGRYTLLPELETAGYRAIGAMALALPPAPDDAERASGRRAAPAKPSRRSWLQGLRPACCDRALAAPGATPRPPGERRATGVRAARHGRSACAASCPQGAAGWPAESMAGVNPSTALATVPGALAGGAGRAARRPLPR